METLTITKRQFEAALLRWTQDAWVTMSRQYGAGMYNASVAESKAMRNPH